MSQKPETSSPPKQPKSAQPGEDFDPQSSNLQKDPDEWVTGEESMTGAQASYLKTLCQEAGEDFDSSLTKAEASEEIDRLQEKTGRGSPGGAST